LAAHSHRLSIEIRQVVPDCVPGVLSTALLVRYTHRVTSQEYSWRALPHGIFYSFDSGYLHIYSHAPAPFQHTFVPTSLRIRRATPHDATTITLIVNAPCCRPLHSRDGAARGNRVDVTRYNDKSANATADTVAARAFPAADARTAR
jgi:hypothetical protein